MSANNARAVEVELLVPKHLNQDTARMNCQAKLILWLALLLVLSASVSHAKVRAPHPLPTKFVAPTMSDTKEVRLYGYNQISDPGFFCLKMPDELSKHPDAVRFVLVWSIMWPNCYETNYSIYDRKKHTLLNTKVDHIHNKKSRILYAPVTDVTWIKAKTLAMGSSNFFCLGNEPFVYLSRSGATTHHLHLK